tara:strand:+ start:468 stop:617 length:150 start_codon:yes stop_codon:yes gene_type:complete
MIKIFIRRLIKKHGMKKLLMIVGDYAVKSTKSRKDDKIWAEVKKVLGKF